MIKFDMPKNQSSIIKVIGVGGGGSNAINHMFEQGIKGVDFIICNTDSQAIATSPVPTKLQLGDGGLGAGSIPSVGQEAAHQKIDEIRDLLEKGTKMLFITAGMGGGTGTGAAPVIAQAAKELGILTVGIVTIPFEFEGPKRKAQAEEGIMELKEHVDTLLIICNERLRELYGDLKLSQAFKKADNVLTTAAKGIAEIITVTGNINVDFEDVKTVMKDSGKAIMGSAEAEGENRAIEAVKAALESPLLNDNDIEGSSDVLLYIASGTEEISMDEISEITNYIQKEAKSQAEIIWGNGMDENLGGKISVTIIATGFDSKARKQQKKEEEKVRYNLNDDILADDFSSATPPEDKVNIDNIELINDKAEEKPVDQDDNLEEEDEKLVIGSLPEMPSKYYEPGNYFEDDASGTPAEEQNNESDKPARDVDVEPKNDSEPDSSENNRIVVFDLSDGLPENNEAKINNEESPAFVDEIKNTLHDQDREDKQFEVFIKKPNIDEQANTDNSAEKSHQKLITQERIEKLKNLSLDLKSESTLEQLETEPAYRRKKVELDKTKPSEESEVSKFALYDDDGKNPKISKNNSFLHDNVD